MGEINLAIAGFYRFLLYDRSSFPQIHLHFKGKKQKRMRNTVSSRGFSIKKDINAHRSVCYQNVANCVRIIISISMSMTSEPLPSVNFTFFLFAKLCLKA